MVNSNSIIQSACSREEKQSLVLEAVSLYRLAVKSFREGILSLEEDIPLIANRMGKLLLRMVVDGCDASLIAECSEIRLVSSGHTGITLLSDIINLEVMKGIQKGEHPEIIFLRMISYYGDDDDLFDLIVLDDHITEDIAFELEEDDQSSLESGISMGLGKLNDLGFLLSFEVEIGTMAILHLDRWSRESIMESITDARRAEIIETAARLTDQDLNASHDRIMDIMTDLGCTYHDCESPEVGFRAAVSLCRENICWLDDLEHHFPQLASKITHSLITVDELPQITDKEIKKVLSGFELEVLAAGIQRSGPSVYSAILRNLGKIPRELFRKNADTGFYRDEVIIDARNRISDRMKLLCDTGEIGLAIR